MKAVDYYKKHRDHIMSSNNVEPIYDLFYEMTIECQELLQTRDIKRDSSAISLIKEQNDKWNAISRLFEKDYGKSPINHNGFALYFKIALEKSEVK